MQFSYNINILNAPWVVQNSIRELIWLALKSIFKPHVFNLYDYIRIYIENHIKPILICP